MKDQGLGETDGAFSLLLAFLGRLCQRRHELQPLASLLSEGFA